MRRKKQAKKITYVGSHRRTRRRRNLGTTGDQRTSHSLGEAAVDPAHAEGVAAGAGAGPLTGRSARIQPAQMKHPLWLDPSAPLPTSMYRTIPLHEGGRARPLAAPQAPLPAQPDPAAPHAQAASSYENPVEKLDRVVHDFVGTLDPGADGQGGCISAQAQRYKELLEHPPSMKGLVLGPSVLLGSSPAVGLESALGMLGSMRKTGVLRVQAGGDSFLVSIVKGDVVHGMSDPRPEPELLGNILVSRGILDADRIERFFQMYGSSTSSIAEALNLEALVSTADLRSALEIQLQLLFDRLLSIRDSVWCFHEGEATLAYINMRMNVISVLLESARKNDERRSA